MVTPEADYDMFFNLWRYRVTACMLELIIEKATAALLIPSTSFPLLILPVFLFFSLVQFLSLLNAEIQMATTTGSVQPSVPRASPHSRPTASHLTYSPKAYLRSPTAPPPCSSRLPPSSLTVSSRPASAPASLFGYTSTIRTISPQIANYRPSTRDIVKAIAPHVLDERKTRRRSLPRTGGSSCPGEPYRPHHHNGAFRPHPRPHLHPSWPQSGNVHRHAEKKELKPSPLRVAAVICWDDNGPIYLREFRLSHPFFLWLLVSASCVTSLVFRAKYFLL